MRSWRRGSGQRERFVALATALTLFAGACAAAVVVVNRDDDQAAAQDDNPVFETTTSLSTTTTTAPEVTPTTLDPLPVPEPPPGDPYANTPIVEVGGIVIPKIGLQHTAFEGITLTVINKGPGHWPGTAMPGKRGNAVFPGHRTTYTKPFNRLDELVPGDEVVFQMPDGVFVYHVRETLIVNPTDLWVVDQTETPTFTLIACHPKGSAAKRIVVKGDLVASFPPDPGA